MSCEQRYPVPEVFYVDGGGGPLHSSQHPDIVTWSSFPPARERMKRHGKSWGSMTLSPGVALIALMLFLLVFAALGFEAYQILNLREKVKDMEKVEPQEAAEFSAPLKQTGYLKSGLELKEEDESSRPAAHVLGRIQNYGSEKTLRWEPKTGQAFTSGGVVYRFQDGSLQVNETGFFQIYSRVEFIFRKCSPTTSFEHLVFKKQAKKPSPTTLMVARRVGFCHPPEQPLTIESYLGSAHHLEQGDRVFVNVSQPNILSHSHYGNFFGLYKI
ncbi:Tumor necrosis factor ligand superfamily member 6 [Oryzias melastigma]|uniref:Tumor necrosis factor ligand superfamily member 6 n=1 Tax=Oryzias melastigma TaxID=30732 RepID=A0A834CEG0_ORYME|nr:Tumor necrosis factor ligand superfamily member 6 [Oryzias melastigma]